YSRKWLKLLEMYEVTLKYLTCTLLSALLGSKEGVPATLAPSLAGLGRPSTGIWHRACFALLKALRDAPDDYFVARYLRALGNVQVKRAQSASEQLVTLRNTTRGYGFIEEEAQYQARYEQHVGQIQALVELLRPLVSYPLLRVGEGLPRRQGVSYFPARLLMGSHPLFPVQDHETSEAVDTDCLLHDPQTRKYLSLYPWLVFDHCTMCFRETVFVYDKLTDEGVV